MELYQIIGFGFCARQDPADEGEGQSFVYRYIPGPLSHNNGRKIIGALNQVAEESKLPVTMATAPKEPEPASDLTPEAMALLESFPIYGVLRVEADAILWDSYWEGQPVITFRAGSLETLMQEALTTPPQDLWAQEHLQPYTRYLFGQNDPEAPAMLMDEPQAKPSSNGGDAEKVVPLPHALNQEKIEYPWGLWKVVLIPLSDSVGAEANDWEQTDEFRVLNGTLGILKGGQYIHEPLNYLRWEIPASLVPNVLRWALDNQLKMEEMWAPIAVMPFNDWDSPIASIPNEPEAEVGIAAAFIVPKAMDEMETGFLAWFEQELRQVVTDK